MLTSARETLQLQTSAGHEVGKLEPRHYKILQVLRDDEDVELQAYVVPTRSQESPRDQARKSFDQRTASRSRTVSLSVILYGSMKIFEAMGEFLEQCSEFLQSPLYCDRNLPYRNPQSLSGKDPNPPMTFELDADLRRSPIETMVQGPDPSAALETEDDLPEMQPPPSIKTFLYK